MKVLLITVRSDFGGGPRHVDQLVDQLPSDIEIYMAYPFNGNPYGEKWDNHVRVKARFPLPHRKFSITALFKLKKFIIQNDINIIHSHGNGAGVYSRLLRFIGVKVKIIHTFHGIANSYSCALKKKLNSFMGKFFCHFTDRFICVSKGEYTIALKKRFLVSCRSDIVYNGIESPTEFVNKKTSFDVVTLSRFDYQKNMDMALDIARKLKKESIQFIWVGDGVDFERLRTSVKHEKLNVVFTGFSKEPFKYLQSASIYLSTSRFEGLPYALIEAASVGLPIVATNVVGNDETLEDGKSGFLFNTVDEAVEYILRLKNDFELCQKMSKRSRSFFEKQFTQHEMIAKLVRIYRDLLLT